MSDNSLNPYDGYRVRGYKLTSRDAYQIFMTLRLGGELLSGSRVVAEFSTRHYRDVDIDRLLPVFEAICRYLNSGGDPNLLADVLRSDSPLFSFVTEARLEFPPELECIACGMTDVCDLPDFQMVFHDAVRGTYLVVVEDTYCEELDSIDLLGSLRRGSLNCESNHCDGTADSSLFGQENTAN